MAFTTLTGSLRDFASVDRFAQLAPALSIVPDGPSTRGVAMLSSIDVPVALNASREFTIPNLVPSAEMVPPTTVSLRLRWLDAAGRPVREDWWRNLWLEAGTQSVGDLIAQQGAALRYVIVSETEPTGPGARVGVLWLQPSTRNLYERTA